MAIAQDLLDAIKEFEALTAKQLPKLTKEGQAASAKKMTGFLKIGRSTVYKLADAFDKAMIGKDVSKVESARKKLTDQLKIFSTDFAKQGAALASDPAMKTGLDVFSKRLTQFALHAKMQSEQKTADLKQLGGAKFGPSETLRKDIRQVYLGIRKGADETDALMTKFIAKPTDENFFAAFSSSTGPRSVGASVTYWKKKVAPNLPSTFNVKQTLGEDPEALIRRIFDITQKHDEARWKKIGIHGKPGWEALATREAKAAMKWMVNFRAIADKMKAYNDQ
jgi:hypothetical protein